MLKELIRSKGKVVTLKYVKLWEEFRERLMEKEIEKVGLLRLAHHMGLSCEISTCLVLKITRNCVLLLSGFTKSFYSGQCTDIFLALMKGYTLTYTLHV